jgi:predicted enzyme related to lactoylglutathione lyase
MSPASHRVVWFEIPAADLGRAQRFYGTILGTGFREEAMGDARMAVFQAPADAVKGCLVQGPHWQPAATGSIVYLNAGPDLQPVLDRVGAAGGEVLVGKTLIAPEIGYYAVLKDSEGNAVGLHSLH